MIIVTGGFGMVGSNLIKKLNQKGFKDILVVDNLENGKKFTNLVNSEITDYLDKNEFLNSISNNYNFGKVEAIFHQGACTSTTIWDGNYMMKNNFEYSRKLLHYATSKSIPFIYASSAAVYGRNNTFKEESSNESALNIYGYSKQLFDSYVRNFWIKTKKNKQIVSQIAGLRYFNVYGPGETHKGSMASVIYHINKQINEGQNPKLFKGSENFKRDFVYVDDVCEVNLWLLDNNISGIFNCGTGNAVSFLEIAKLVINYKRKGDIEFIPFPDKLKNCYQNYTQADLDKLRNSGCILNFKNVHEGINSYLNIIEKTNERL